MSLLLSNIDLTVTAYSPRPCETDDTPTITANQTVVREGIVAVSRDIKRHTLYGDYIILLTDEGLDMLEIQDLMHWRWRRKVDKFFFSTEDALKYGRKKGKALILSKLKRDV